MPRDFTASPAKRGAANLIIGLVGPSSSGKTYTALELATGIQSVVGGDIDLIDTEHGRALFYADPFKFNHVKFDAPYASLDYRDAILQSVKRGAKTIIVDSLSHEHDSEGGMLDYQDQELTRMAGQDYAKRERMQMLAWAKPKAARRKLLQAIATADANLILCFRAKNTSKPGKDANGKSVVIPMGFVPIAGEEFVFEASLSLLFHPNAGGVPTYNPDLVGERIALKIPKQFEWIKDHMGPVDREIGARLAKWAAGETKLTKSTKAASAPDFDADGFVTEVSKVAADSVEASTLDTWWNSPETTARRKQLAQANQDKSQFVRSLVADRIGELVAGSEV